VSRNLVLSGSAKVVQYKYNTIKSVKVSELTLSRETAPKEVSLEAAAEDRQ